MNLDNAIGWLTAAAISALVIFIIVSAHRFLTISDKALEYLKAIKPPTKTGSRIFQHDKSGFSFTRWTGDENCVETIGVPYDTVDQITARVSVEPSIVDIKLPSGQKIRQVDKIIVVTIRYRDGRVEKHDKVIMT